MTYRYLLLYKPYNVLSQFTDEGNRSTLKDFVSVPNVYSVGRLDRDSEGLLLLTNDGAMQHRLSHPKFGHRRRYWAQVEQAHSAPPLEPALQKLRDGVMIRGYQTKKAEIRAIAPPSLPPRNPPIRYRKQVPTTWLEIILREGKNRQVRRMTASVGFPTLRLVRSGLMLSEKLSEKSSDKLSDQLLTLVGLEPGQWRDLTTQEVRQLPRL